MKYYYPKLIFESKKNIINIWKIITLDLKELVYF